MKKIIFSLLILTVVLTGVSLVCASDVDNGTDIIYSDFNFNDNATCGGAIVPVGDKPDFNANNASGNNAIEPIEWAGPNVDNYHFEDDYPTPEEMDESTDEKPILFRQNY